MPRMPRLPRLPEEVARWFAPLKPYLHHPRHYAVLAWAVVAHSAGFEKATLQALARHTPARVAAWRARRPRFEDYREKYDPYFNTKSA